MTDEVAIKLTNAIVHQSTTNERLAAVLERYERGLPRPSVAVLIVVVGLSSLVGSMTALAWGVP